MRPWELLKTALVIVLHGGQAYLLGTELTKEISATDLMWDFFLRHPKK
jgi:poly(3-hydroxybutyrate) depolymerase